MLDLLALRGLPYLQMVVWLWLMEEREDSLLRRTISRGMVNDFHLTGIPRRHVD